MGQPTPYEPTTDFSDEELENVGGRSTVRTAALDTELADIALTLRGVRSSIATMQRDDGKLRDGLVEIWNLSVTALAALSLDLNPRGSWVTARAYAVNDLVERSGTSFLCMTAHTSGTFTTDRAAGKWQLLSSGAMELYPEFYGAVGDDSTNDYTAFVDLVAATASPRLAGSTYKSNSVIAFGGAVVLGQRGSVIHGPGITLGTGSPFYDAAVGTLELKGTGGQDQTGLTADDAHRLTLRDVVITGYRSSDPAHPSQAQKLTTCYLANIFGGRTQDNEYGNLYEEGSNGVNVFGATASDNDHHGDYVQGSTCVVFFGGDAEYNADGMVFSNYSGVTPDAAEPRNNGVIGRYFEGNTHSHIWIGDQPGPAVTRYTFAAFNYMLCVGVDYGVIVDHSDSALLLWNRPVGTADVAETILGADAANTTIIPFPQGRDGDIANSKITAHASATVSPQTIQWDVDAIVVDGAGNGFVDVFFKVKYATVPTINLQHYSSGDRLTAPPTLLLNSVTVSGFRVRVIGAAALESVGFMWRAGA